MKRKDHKIVAQGRRGSRAAIETTSKPPERGLRETWTLVGCLGTMVAALVIVGWRGLAGMRDINRQLNTIEVEQFEPALRIANANLALLDWNRAILNFILAEASERPAFRDVQDAQQQRMVTRVVQLEDLPHLSTEGRALVVDVRQHFTQAQQIQKQIVALTEAGSDTEAHDLLQHRLRPLIDRIDTRMTDFLRLQETQLEEIKRATDARYRQAMGHIGWLIGLALLAAGIAVWFVWRGHRLLLRLNERLRQEMVERQRIERFKDDFIYIIPHELRTPVTALREGAEMFAGGALGNLDSEQQDFFKVMVADIDRMSQLMQKIELAEQLVLDRCEFAKQPMDLARMVEEVAAAVSDGADAKRIKVEVARNVTSAPWVGDARKLTEALRELVDNASGASPAGGTVRLSCAAAPAGWQIEVADNGSGIPAEELPTMFERMGSVGTLGERKTGGIGLGLFIAKKIVEAHDGTIELDSTVGQGTTARIILPATRQQVA